MNALRLPKAENGASQGCCSIAITLKFRPVPTQCNSGDRPNRGTHGSPLLHQPPEPRTYEETRCGAWEPTLLWHHYAQNPALPLKT